MPRPRVFFDIQIGTQPAGRITIELFDDKTPKTCENFRLLCTGSNGTHTAPGGLTHPLHYKNSTFHRVISEFMIQGGDITNGDGTGGVSIYDGNMFADENLGWRKIDKEGLVCMANRGKGTNSSQFFITLAECEYLTDKHTLFGHIVAGMDVAKKIEELKVDDSDRPLEDVIIANSGELVFKRRDTVPVPAARETRKELEVRSSPRSRSRERGKRDERRGDESVQHHRRKRSRDGKSRYRKSRSRSRPRGEQEDSISSPLQPKRVPSRSRSRHRHRRRRYHSGSRSPSRRRHRRHREKAYEYTRDEEAEERIRREENEREMERFARMDGDRGVGRSGEPEVKFKGRGSMKYREKKNWGYGGGEGRLT
ncbi:cyclophilin-like domain-containing protein [Morchella snyderi]|nr:cyclophilin-like domain-containing protein [Morchella snyderi]